jgi:Arc/MetJ-type ribon-helix-helix transcriptional regulator
MTIHLPEELASSIRPLVLSGRFTSEDDIVAEALREYLRRHAVPDAAPGPLAADQSPARGNRPIWEVAADLRAGIPAEERARLPADAAAELDHYLYGAPKRRP